jgi:proline iminopeptidase
MRNSLIIFALAVFVIGGCKKLDPNEDGNLVAKTVSEDNSLPSIQLSSTKLHCQTYGSKSSTKIFILEGGPGDDFKYLLDLNKVVNNWSLTQNYQVIYHDYRGCGLSQRHPMSELTQANSLKDLEELIDYYAPNQKVILLGHSHGGSVAAQYFNRHSDRIKGVIFIEPGSFSSDINKKQPQVNSVNYFAKDINQILWIKQLIGMDNHAKADYAYDVGRINRENAERGESCVASNYRGGAASAIAIAINEVYNSTYDYTAKMSMFPTKVLFISSDQSTDLGYDFQQQYQASLFKNYDHKKIIGTGHNGLINCRTNETLGYIKNYLKDL